jgi:hypothetical protein
MPSWKVRSRDGGEVSVPEGAELQLIFTSADDLIGFLNSTILPVARQFGYEVLVRPVGMAVVRPGV